MKKSIPLFFFILTFTVSLYSQSIIQNRFSRQTKTLNGKWHYLIDPYETGYMNYRGIPKEQMENPPKSDAFFLNYVPADKTQRVEYSFDLSPCINVPGDWNTQSEKLLYFEGSLWYKRAFDYSKSASENRVFVNFGAANYRTDAYINGKKVGEHEGGFTPFSFEFTHLLKPKDNFIVVRVKNERKKENVPALNADWWNYGGITRDIDIIETPPVFIHDYLVQLKKGDPHVIKGFMKLNGDKKTNRKVSISIPELKIEEVFTTDKEGMAEFEIKAKRISYWTPERPKLYRVILRNGDEEITDQIGFRTLSVQGQDILLNGKSVFLRGISIHEENPIRGNRNFCEEDARQVLNWAKELGCNFVRLAHYPHNEYMVRMADKMGIMVWAEDPVYWNILFDNEETYQIAEKQLRELITRDKNRAAVIIWSMANETPVNKVRFNFLSRLAKKAREMDDTRLISAALEVSIIEGKTNHYTIDDPFADVVDVMSFNEYIGWYDGLPDKCSKISWEIKQNKPVFISEFGGGALQGYHADSLTRWTEEFQEYLYRESIKMLETIPQLRGMSPWILADFRSPKRFLPHIQDGWNRKGLISETGNRKKAFYVLQEYYNMKAGK
jgi:beta-glucuronidase